MVMEGAKAKANLAGRGARQKQQAGKDRGSRRQVSGDHSKEVLACLLKCGPALGTLSLIHLAGHCWIVSASSMKALQPTLAGVGEDQ